MPSTNGKTEYNGRAVIIAWCFKCECEFKFSKKENSLNFRPPLSVPWLHPHNNPAVIKSFNCLYWLKMPETSVFITVYTQRKGQLWEAVFFGKWSLCHSLSFSHSPTPDHMTQSYSRANQKQYTNTLFKCKSKSFCIHIFSYMWNLQHM